MQVSGPSIWERLEGMEQMKQSSWASFLQWPVDFSEQVVQIERGIQLVDVGSQVSLSSDRSGKPGCYTLML